MSAPGTPLYADFYGSSTIYGSSSISLYGTSIEKGCALVKNDGKSRLCPKEEKMGIYLNPGNENFREKL